MSDMFERYGWIVVGLLVLMIMIFLAFVFYQQYGFRRGPSKPTPPEGEDAEVTEIKKEEQEEKEKEQEDVFNKWIVPNLGYLIYLGGCALVSIVALFEPFWLSFAWGEVLGLILWSGLYLAFGVVIIPQQEAWTIERFGQYQRTASAGIRILCFQSIIDKISDRVSLQWHTVKLWSDEKGQLNSSAEIVFEGGVSAPVEVEVIYRVISPFAWVYQAANSRGYIEAVIDAALRPALQQLTIEVANKRKGNIGWEILNGEGSQVLKNAMALIGVELHPEKGILVKDIDIPEDIQKLRALELEGQQNAKKATAQAAGYTGAVKAIMADAKEAGYEMSWKEAEAFYFSNRSLETMAASSANITMIGDNILGIAANILGRKPPTPSSSTPPAGTPTPPTEGPGMSPRKRGNR